MSTHSSTAPILIVGGGLSGLALAHGLRSHDIPFQIFERDTSPLFRAQGYRIRIQDFYLKQLLPRDLWQVFEDSCAQFTSGGVRIDAITGESTTGGFGGGQPNDPGKRPSSGEAPNPPRPLMTEGKPRNVDRRVLRNLMIEPLVKEGGLIHFGKRFVKYKTDDEGVIAYFADGTQYKGRLLVGADGSKSLVRKQMLPHFQIYDTEGRSIYGKTLITDDIWAKIPKGIQGGMSMISDIRNQANPIKIICEVMRFANRDKVKMELPQDYLYWVMTLKKGQSGMDDDEFIHLSSEGSAEVALNLSKDWDALCQGIVKTHVPDQVATLAFAIADPRMEDWEVNSRVTLMGDAAHPMTPVGGVGANAAFQDATLVLRAILDGAKVEDIAKYEGEMRQNARRYVAGSIQGSTHVFGMKPFEQLEPLVLST